MNVVLKLTSLFVPLGKVTTLTRNDPSGNKGDGGSISGYVYKQSSGAGDNGKRVIRSTR